MELLKARLTLASMVTVSPRRMGRSKETLLTAAVTTTLRQWRFALMADAMSIQFKSCPPMRLPKTLVSLGSTMWVVVAKLSFAWRVFGAIMGACCPAKVGL